MRPQDTTWLGARALAKQSEKSGRRMPSNKVEPRIFIRPYERLAYKDFFIDN